MGAVTTGVLGDRLPFVRIGEGPHVLLVLTGLSLTDDAPSGLALSAYARGFRRLAVDHTLYLVSRPRGIPVGASTRSLAAEYAPLVHQALGGRVRLLGFSTGGLIAQHLALDQPDLIERVALVVSGARLAPPGRALCTGWLAAASEGRWRDVHGGLAASAVDGRTTQWLARAVLSRTGRPPTPREAGDFCTTVAAVLAHDTRAALSRLQMPALVLGGSEDPFFPDPVLRETAAAIPRASLRIYPGHGHGVPKHLAGPMQEEIAAFFSGDGTQ